jgi:hypothetical protein
MVREGNHPELNTEVTSRLGEFSQSCLAVAKLLQGGAKLTDQERLSLENHMAIVQLTYAVWTRKSDQR